MSLLRRLPVLLVATLVGCASGRQLPAIHAVDGRYSVHQVEQAFAAAGLQPLGGVPGWSNAYLGSSRIAAIAYGHPPGDIVAFTGISVFVDTSSAPSPRLVFKYLRRGGGPVARRGNVEIVYDSRHAQTVQAVLSELR